eukprot:CAMPEP_0176118310 /NCGR_PEP_ID=MMETSP0120_2-20121206/59454_1 /TAXON_ID=160619 /ORGANISM="Kryptoperidinium foliaceum, Strain CCMP 1326" /LENGTH=366 /DNA_ID=CAMNT_0017452641 /DNA_START=33 /DNA_END=1130 /DNA_ORIENTATION=-
MAAAVAPRQVFAVAAYPAGGVLRPAPVQSSPSQGHRPVRYPMATPANVLPPVYAQDVNTRVAVPIFYDTIFELPPVMVPVQPVRPDMAAAGVQAGAPFVQGGQGAATPSEPLSAPMQMPQGGMMAQPQRATVDIGTSPLVAGSEGQSPPWGSPLTVGGNTSAVTARRSEAPSFGAGGGVGSADREGEYGSIGGFDGGNGVGFTSYRSAASSAAVGEAAGALSFRSGVPSLSPVAPDLKAMLPPPVQPVQSLTMPSSGATPVIQLYPSGGVTSAGRFGMAAPSVSMAAPQHQQQVISVKAPESMAVATAPPPADPVPSEREPVDERAPVDGAETPDARRRPKASEGATKAAASKGRSSKKAATKKKR